MKTQIIELQKLTKLPIQIVSIAEKSFPDIYISTPHKGDYRIPLKKESYGFFGGGSQMDIHSNLVIGEIHKLEEETKDFLLEEWLKSNA